VPQLRIAAVGGAFPATSVAHVSFERGPIAFTSLPLTLTPPAMVRCSFVLRRAGWVDIWDRGRDRYRGVDRAGDASHGGAHFQPQVRPDPIWSLPARGGTLPRNRLVYRGACTHGFLPQHAVVADSMPICS
jgi:hypothetical protein